MKKIVKFGGSSLANAEQFQKVGEIIRSDESRRYVVPSAPGKRFDGDTKVTDLLYKCYNTAVEGEDFIPILQEIKGRYYEIIRGLNLDLSLEDEFAQIEADFKAQAGTDYAASRGEFLNGKVMAAYLGYEFVDAADVIRFDKNGNLDAEKTDRLLSKKLAKCEHAAIDIYFQKSIERADPIGIIREWVWTRNLFSSLEAFFRGNPCSPCRSSLRRGLYAAGSMS